VGLTGGFEGGGGGVKISDLHKIEKRIKQDYALALKLYATGNFDAMYLAGLITDVAKMTRKDLTRWGNQAYCKGLYEATVPWVAAGSPQGWELALTWIESKTATIAAAGWATLGSIVSVNSDTDIDFGELKACSSGRRNPFSRPRTRSAPR